MGSGGASSSRLKIRRKRWRVLKLVECWLEPLMIGLAFVWLILLVVEFVGGERPWVVGAGTSIWIIFSIDFLLRFAIAPSKLAYLKKNWLTALSLVVPALRIFRTFAALRVVRLARVSRSLRLVRVVSSVNRSMHALGLAMRRRGFGYVIVLTIFVTLVGAAGMVAFEKDVGEQVGPRSYADALWWTAMIMTTMGSDYWPKTMEGRLLCLFLSIYAFAVFGYVTATIATFFIGRDSEGERTKSPPESSMESLRKEIAELRKALQKGEREG